MESGVYDWVALPPFSFPDGGHHIGNLERRARQVRDDEAEVRGEAWAPSAGGKSTEVRGDVEDDGIAEEDVSPLPRPPLALPSPPYRWRPGQKLPPPPAPIVRRDAAGNALPPPRPNKVKQSVAEIVFPEVVAYLDRRRHFRVTGERDLELEAEQAREKERLQRVVLERSKPLYLCDQSAVRIMVKAVTEGPSPLGAWVQQQIADGYLWACGPVDAIPGWKLLTPDPRCMDYGAPEGVHRLFRRHCLGADAENDPELYDTVATYLRVHSFIGTEASYDRMRRLVTANRAFQDVFLGNEEKRCATQRELFGLSFAHRGGSGPVVLYVDDVHQEKPEGLPFQADVASVPAQTGPC